MFAIDYYRKAVVGTMNQGNPQTFGFVDDSLSGMRQQLEGHFGQIIDQYAASVPGGEHFTPEAKQALSGVLDGLQKQLEAQAANRLGGLGGLAGLGSSGNTGTTGKPVTGIGNQQSDQSNIL